MHGIGTQPRISICFSVRSSRVKIWSETLKRLQVYVRMCVDEPYPHTAKVNWATFLTLGAHAQRGLKMLQLLVHFRTSSCTLQKEGYYSKKKLYLIRKAEVPGYIQHFEPSKDDTTSPSNRGITTTYK